MLSLTLVTIKGTNNEKKDNIIRRMKIVTRGPFLQGMIAYHNHSQFITCGVLGSVTKWTMGWELVYYLQKDK
jgi:hypothetical protein